MELPIPAIWVDGEPATGLPLPDRGLDFGDGLFETLLLWRGKPLFADLHFARLQQGLRRLSFPDCTARCEHCLAAALASLDAWEWSALRLTVTRGGGPRGYAPPLTAQPRIVVTAAPLAQDRRAFPAALHVGVARVRWSVQPMLAGLKHLNRLEQVLAAGEAQAAGWDEALVLDADGQLCSLAAANLFLVEGGRLATPLLDRCGIEGTRRRLVCERLADAAGLTVAEERIGVERLLSADEVFCCNSLRGLQPVGRCGNRQWRRFAVAECLHEHYVGAMPC